MNRRINFEDNSFALNLRVRMVRDLLALDTDGELFLAKTLEDLRFTDQSLEILRKALEENTQLIDREGQFDNLSELEWQFSRVLSEFLNGSASLSAANFPHIRKDLSFLRERSDGRRELIDRVIFSGDRAAAEPVVSGAELSELLKDLA